MKLSMNMSSPVPSMEEFLFIGDSGRITILSASKTEQPMTSVSGLINDSSKWAYKKTITEFNLHWSALASFK